MLSHRFNFAILVQNLEMTHAFAANQMCWILFPSGGAILALLVFSIITGSLAYIHCRENQQLRDQVFMNLLTNA